MKCIMCGTEDPKDFDDSNVMCVACIEIKREAEDEVLEAEELPDVGE